MDDIAIHWFRNDLRLFDNPAFVAAARHKKILPIYIHDDETAGEYAMGAASRWWLYHSLQSLNRSLKGKLSVYAGKPAEIISNLVSRFGIRAIYWNRCYEPWRVAYDRKLKNHLYKLGVNCESYNGTLLWEPWTIAKEDGSPYKVFTPFYRKGCLKADPPRLPLPVPQNISCSYDLDGSVKVDELSLLSNLRWYNKLASHWNIGEKAAKSRFEKFRVEGLKRYKEGRNLPADKLVSRMSPHLRFGEISPNQLWYSVRGGVEDENIEHFCSELGWREFSYSQLFYNPDLPERNLNKKFDKFPWVDDSNLLTAWKKGLTGIPMVDAGMRELWQTGYMHNRSRMIVGSFLVKNLGLHWRHGERWFWDTLVDADLANNSAGWQWIAGCGADAAPYFRVFNPVLQGQKFDANGRYVRHFVPEIASLPNEFLFNPWDADEIVLKRSNIDLGRTYPRPIVDLKVSRESALEAYKSI
ncbi:MAG: deoxyribodipyrimidine photo-lyase [Pseudomonadota bacterium]|nr:deoxyribodipyrimidine photo-lyase [Pseudomonadota bacterium]